MMDVRAARIAAHQANLTRYRRILASPLTDHERAYVRSRLDEERRQLQALECAEAGSAQAA